MRKSVFIGGAYGLFSLVVGTLGAAPTWSETSDGKYEVIVPTGESYTLTAADVTAIGERDLVKKGEGTLVAGEEMASFAGDIFVRDGFYDATTTNAFGTAAGETYVNGGTILSRLDGTIGGKGAYGQEAFHLAGTGCQSNGVIRQTKVNSACFTRGRITFDDDVLLTGSESLDFRFGQVDVNGHDITVAMAPGKAFRFVALKAIGWANVNVLSGQFGLESDVDGGTADSAITMESNTCFLSSNLKTPQGRRLVFRPGSSYQLQYYCEMPAVLGQHNGKTEWRGPVVLEGASRLLMANVTPGRVADFSGFVSGPGGFMAKNGLCLQLGCETNAFRGGAAAEGVVASDGWSVAGGVSAMGPGALPPDGGSVDLTNAAFFAYAENTLSNLCLNTRVEYPDMTVHGTGVITSGASFTSLDLRSLTKTGTGPLTMFGAFHVMGRTDVAGGTLRFGSSVPTVLAGLDWHYGLRSGWDLRKSVPTDFVHHGVDARGASFAYRGWKPTMGKNGSPDHDQAHFYTGWIRIPDAPDEKVKCNFVSSICRRCYLVIDGKEVVAMNDSTDTLTGTTFPGWKRFYVGPQVELKSGWRSFHLYMSNFHDTTCGPYNHGEFGWVADFGVGVDWRGGCVTNSANYDKLLDPGDGSFLRASMDDFDKAATDPSQWRPTFDGPMAFGPGTTLDVNDVEPYTPLAVSELVGTPAITNGAVTVAGATWTLRAADLLAGGRLSVAANARVSFPARVTVDITDVADLRDGKYEGGTILAAATAAGFPDGTVFRPSDATKAARWRLEWSGNALNVCDASGLVIVFR